MFGFGRLTGVLTLSFATIGVNARRLAEDIGAIDHVQAKSVQATGASRGQVVNGAVQPQAMPWRVGLSL